MINRRSCHSACSMGNKLFIIGGHKNKSCEVFDSFSGKFTFIRSAPFEGYGNQCVCLGNKINVYRFDKCKVFVFNTEENNWVIRKLNINKSKYEWLSCVRCPNTCSFDVAESLSVPQSSYSKFLCNEVSRLSDNSSESGESSFEISSSFFSENGLTPRKFKMYSWSDDYSSSDSFIESPSESDENENNGNDSSESFLEPAAKRFKGNEI